MNNTFRPQWPNKLSPYWTFLQIRTCIQYQQSVPLEEAVCPLCSNGGGKGIEVWVVDGCTACDFPEIPSRNRHMHLTVTYLLTATIFIP